MKKREKKEKKEIEKIPFTLEAKIGLVFFIGIVVFCVIGVILGAIFPSFATLLWRVFGGFVSAMRYLPSQYCTIKIASLRGAIHYIFLFLLIVSIIVSLILENNTSIPKKIRNTIYNHLMTLSFCLSGFIILFSFSWVLLYDNFLKITIVTILIVIKI